MMKALTIGTTEAVRAETTYALQKPDKRANFCNVQAKFERCTNEVRNRMKNNKTGMNSRKIKRELKSRRNTFSYLSVIRYAIKQIRATKR